MRTGANSQEGPKRLEHGEHDGERSWVMEDDRKWVDIGTKYERCEEKGMNSLCLVSNRLVSN